MQVRFDGRLWELLGITQAEAEHKGYVKATRKLRQPLYDTRIPLGYKGPIAGLAQPDEILAPPSFLHWRQLNHLALAWWHHPKMHFVDNGPLRLAFRVRLGLSLVQDDMLCQNFRPGTLRHCLQPVGPEALHPQQRCKAAITHRHHSVRDVLLEQCKLAGWTALPEQLVQCNPSSALPDVLNRHRCDLLAIQPSGKTCVLEVGITAVSRLAKAQQAMFSVWREKSRRYGAPAARDLLPGGEVLTTFIASGWGAFHAKAWELLLQLGADQATKALATEVPAASQLWLHRASVVSAVQRVLLQSQWRILQQSVVQHRAAEPPG